MVLRGADFLYARRVLKILYKQPRARADDVANIHIRAPRRGGRVGQHHASTLEMFAS
jgi:hypothetical protein